MEERPHTIDPSRAEFLGEGPIPRTGEELLRRYLLELPDGVLKDLLTMPGATTADVDFRGPNVQRARVRARVPVEQAFQMLRDGATVDERGMEVGAPVQPPQLRPPTDAVMVTEATIRDAEVDVALETKGPVEIRFVMPRGTGRWALSPDGRLWAEVDDAPVTADARVDTATVVELVERVAERIRSEARPPVRWVRWRRVSLEARSPRRGALRMVGAVTVRWLLFAVRVRATLLVDVRGRTLRTRVGLSSRNPFVGLPLRLVKIEQPEDVDLVEEGIDRLEFRVRRGVVEVHVRTNGKEAS